MTQTDFLIQAGHNGSDDHIWTVTPQDITLPRRPRDAHKGNFGKVTILAGCTGYSGAPILAAQSCERSGAGLVTLLVPDSIWAIAAVKLTGPMPWPLPSVEMGSDRGSLSKAALTPALEKLSSADAVLLGPGLGRGEETVWVIHQLLSRLSSPVVLDADGINALQGHIDVLDERKGLSVLTPHDGEFARIGGDLSGGDRVAAARRFAREHHCILVLKGRRTVTAFPDGDAFVNTTGNPGMAKGGSGDILAGMILSLLGQGHEPKHAVPWAVCLHGQAGDVTAAELGEYGMTPADMLLRIPAVFKRF